MKLTNEAMSIMIDTMTPLKETGKLGYAIAYNLRKMADETKEYLDMKAKLLQKYGEQTANGYSLNAIKNPDKFQAYMDEMGDIPKIEHEIDIFKVSPEDLYSSNLTSNQMANLMWMVDDGKPEKVEGEVV